MGIWKDFRNAGHKWMQQIGGSGSQVVVLSTDPADGGVLFKSGSTGQYTTKLIGDSTAGVNVSLTLPAAGTKLASNPMTAANDMVYGGTFGLPTRLPNTGGVTFLYSGGGGIPSWQAIDGSYINNSSIANAKISDVSARKVSGDPSGTTPLSGYIGDMATGTSPRNGTNGQTYSVRNATGISTAPVAVCPLVLTPGIYLYSAKIYGDTGGAIYMDSYARIGGTQVTSTTSVLFANRANINFCFPVIITTTTTIDIVCVIGSGSTTSNAHEAWAVRIA